MSISSALRQRSNGARTTYASMWADPDDYSQDVCAAHTVALFFFKKYATVFDSKKSFKK